MLLSVIVPVYNVKDYVIKCLESIEAQTNLTDYEVIVVDDGSTDGSGEIVDAFCKDKENFRVIHKENGGLMSAWTKGVENAIGEYIGFVDSDDYIAPEMYSSMLEKAIKHNVDIVMCERLDIDGDKKWSSDAFKKRVREGLYKEDKIKTIYRMVFPLPSVPELTKSRCNKLFKSHIVKENLKYCECLSKTFEDRYITPACIFSAKSFYYLAKPFYFYLHREGSNSGMYKKNLIDEIKRMYFVQEQILKDKGLFDEYGENWEYIFMDYVRQYVTRNLLNVKGFFVRITAAKNLFSDEIVKERLNKYGKEMKSKLGKCVYIAYKLKLPIILVIVSYFGK